MRVHGRDDYALVTGQHERLADALIRQKRFECDPAGKRHGFGRLLSRASPADVGVFAEHLAR